MSQTLRTLGAVALGAFSSRRGAVGPEPTGLGRPEASDPPVHSITVSATGKVTVVPDVARVNLGVTLTKTTVKAARDAGAQAMTDHRRLKASGSPMRTS